MIPHSAHWSQGLANEKPETPNANHATSHFWREMQMVTLQERQVDLSRPKKARSASQEVDL